MKFEEKSHRNIFPIPATYWFLQFFAYLIFVVGMFQFVPTSVVQSPSAKLYIDFMASWIPMINEIEKVPGFHPFLRLYYAAMWGIVPVLAFGTIVLAARTPQVINKRDARLAASIRPLLLGLIGVTVFVLVMFSWPINPASLSSRDKSTVQSVFGIVWFGLVSLWCLTLWFGYLFVLQERIFNALASRSSRR
jgi:hypothetical protein